MKILKNIFNWRKKTEGTMALSQKTEYIPIPYESNFDYYGDDEDDKYKIVHKAFGLADNLPFEPTTDEVIYVENEYDEKTNRCIRENIDFIRESFAKRGLVFVYIPLLGEDLKNNADVWYYRGSPEKTCV